MKATSHNPIGFAPLPVTILTSIVYLALISTLLVIHLVVPPAPEKSSPIPGINITEAWHDLQTLTNGFHPYNSRRNDNVRDWLLQRLEVILASNGVAYTSVNAFQEGSTVHNRASVRTGPSSVVIFNDMISNLTFSSNVFGDTAPSVYFEGTNIIVYIRGSEDEDGDWWNSTSKARDRGGVLINAHYDSVSTAFGATDDGVGVVTILQLIKFFSISGNQPKKGIIALLNNGEEDFLNGARAFTQHPVAQFAHVFLNLEGAGAGGRATLFRSTDTEVTRFYGSSPHPFGTVVSGDGFKRGLIRSQTDYKVFNEDLGLRGLDVAFMEPRARYHTSQDDTRHSSINSLWHMLSMALATMQGLAADTSSTFVGKVQGKGKVQSGTGSAGVWFDLFGRGFAIFKLHTLFALSVTLLVVTPISLIVIASVLLKVDKLYLFSSSKHHHHSAGDDIVPLRGWRGFFRYPLIFVLATAGNVGLAFLVQKVNPYIVYSSPYAVWSMMLSAWVFVVWFFSRVMDFWRPTALHRAYSLLWMFGGGWAILVLVTVLENNLQVAAGYFMVFYFAAIFLATVIALLELFGLPTKSSYANDFETHGDDHTTIESPRPSSNSSVKRPASGTDETAHESRNNEHDEEEATESTSLLPGGKPTTFARYITPNRERDAEELEVLDEPKKSKVYGDEQPWSWSLPSWTWLLQFILLALFPVITVGQVGLLFVSATSQTLADGNSPLLVHIAIAIFSILLLAPLGPFLHRYSYHIPTFLLCAFVGTLVYNLLAFPFSTNNRLKLFFVQHVDLDTGINEVSLTGVGAPYMDEIIANLPSASDQSVTCGKSSRPGLVKCGWNGLPPQVVPNTHPEVPPEFGYADWLYFNVTREEGRNEASFHLYGQNTRACRILFNSPISNFHVNGSSENRRYPKVSDAGSKEIRLWRRTWEKPWDVSVQWDVGEGRQAGEDGMDGKVVCLWSDHNALGVIPALDEIQRFAPDWVIITKLDDGLVQGSKAFMI